MSTTVLNHAEVNQKIERIAWQIYEEFYDEQEVIIAGIASRGYWLAKALVAKLEEISQLKVSLHELSLDKDHPIEGKAEISPTIPDLENRCVVVVDDVLKSGSTLIYGVKYFLDFPLKSLKTVVLVDRNHKRFPVKADFKGLSLSTSLKEHVSVEIEQEPFSVQVF